MRTKFRSDPFLLKIIVLMVLIWIAASVSGCATTLSTKQQKQIAASCSGNTYCIEVRTEKAIADIEFDREYARVEERVAIEEYVRVCEVKGWEIFYDGPVPHGVLSRVRDGYIHPHARLSDYHCMTPEDAERWMREQGIMR
jgi:hypothetical protein